MTTDLMTRNTSRRVVIELIVVVLLVGLPVDFPRGVASGTAWSFLFRHPSVLAHAALGTLLLGEGVLFLVRAAGAGGRRPALTAALGLAGIVAAVASGVAYVTRRQPDDALTGMTAGWLVALVVFVAGWIGGRRALRAGRTPVDVR